MPEFVPTEEDRRWVKALIGIRMTVDEICKLIKNPRTNHPIDLKTFNKVFAEEVAIGRANIRGVVGRKLYEALEKGEQWAINFGLRHFHGYRNEDVTVSVGAGGSAANAEDVGIEVTFRRPRPVEDD